MPGYTPSLVRAGLLTASYVYLEKHGLLLDVGRKHPHGKEMSFSVAQFDGLHAGAERVGLADVIFRTKDGGRALHVQQL